MLQTASRVAAGLWFAGGRVKDQALSLAA